MANIRKSFSFRNGVQVDEDNLIVNSNGLVGIGTSIPTEVLDVRGTLKVVGVATIRDAFIGVATVTENLKVGIVSISEDGYIRAVSGVVTFLGDGSQLSDLPTSQWIDKDVGLGFTSIYAAGNVGISTVDPRFDFQVGGNNLTTVVGFSSGVGINSVGDILATGIMTARSFYGQGNNLTELDADNITAGTLDNARLYRDINIAGVVTATGGFVGDITGDVVGDVVGDVTGNLVGIATTARGLTGTPDITVGDIIADTITANTINVPSTGIVTATKLLHVGSGGTAVSGLEGGRLGIGSALPTSDLQIRKSSGTLLEVVAETGQSRISIGQSVGVGHSSAVLRYGNSDKSFDILNNDNGSISMYLHAANTSGINTGRFDWIYGQTNAELMSLTYDGSLGIGKTNPDNTLHVVGTSTVTGDAFIGGTLTVAGGITGSVTLDPVFQGNVNSISGVSTFNGVEVNSTLFVSIGSSVGIGTDDPIEGLDARTQTGLFLSVGVNTNLTYNNAVISADGNAVISSGVGIGTTNFDPSGAAIQSYAPLIDVNEGHLNLKSDSTVGFDTSDPKAVFDFSNVGAATTRPVMVVPNIDNTVITGIAETPTGSIIFNTTTSKFQGYTGVAWTDFH